jgi:hypothetical protein
MGALHTLRCNHLLSLLPPASLSLCTATRYSYEAYSLLPFGRPHLPLIIDVITAGESERAARETARETAREVASEVVRKVPS